ncbi:MAG: polysaccharide biosynthesis protein [Clostridia bacterium]|nr:polysaccharide biosynthesis protein [Clostridia bacterium]
MKVLFKVTYTQKIILLILDIVLASLSLLFSVILSRGGSVFFLPKSALIFTAISFFAFPLFTYVNGSHRVIWRYAGVRDIVKLVIAQYTAFAFSVLATSVIGGEFIFTAIEWISAMLLTSVASVTLRMFLRHISVKNNKKEKRDIREAKGEFSNYGNTMIVGGGGAAEILLREIFTSASFTGCVPVVIVDDNKSLHGLSVRGVPIAGGRNDIEKLVRQHKIKSIFLAIPSISAKDKREILKICSQTGCDTRVVPSIDEMMNISSSGLKMRKVEIADLLGRQTVKINDGRVLSYVENKTVMVTGGGGSIGSELCRQIASHSPKKLIIFDIYENNAYDIQNELKRNFPDLDLVCLIGSVRDKKRLDSVFDKYRPEIVYHAAAHKHVPLMEDSPNEAVKNNVFGTLNTVRAADKYGVHRFVLISTDKAVNPTNVMGATKRICEMIVQTYNNRSKTEYVAVRFGNVLGSNGSVIPLFEKQIEKGGPVTVTHPDIIRYFMTIPEAASLVLQAGANAEGGEIFVLDMGDPVKILDLAENMIRLSGFEPYADIDIKFTGLRPGEKLYEELLMDEEGLKTTDNELIHIGKPIVLDEEELLSSLAELEEVMSDDNADIRGFIHRLVPTFKEPNEVNAGA